MLSETRPLLTRSRSTSHTRRQSYRVGHKSLSDVSRDNSSDSFSVKSHDGAPISHEEGDQSLRRIVIAVLIAMCCIIFILIILIPVFLSSAYDRSRHHSTSTIESRVDRILSQTPLIDGHNDLAMVIRFLYQNRIYDNPFASDFERKGMPLHVDLPRLRTGKVGGAFWSAFVPCPKDGMDFSDGNYNEAVAMTYSQIDLIRRLTVAYPDTFLNPVLNSRDAFSEFMNGHKLISPIGVEGLHQIGNSISNLRLYHSVGVKYSTLTHNCHNAFADAALVTNSSGTDIAAPPYWKGLSDRGQLLITEMNRLGMLVDLAHVSKDTMLDVLGGNPEKTAGSAAPIMFSHSSAYALCPHPRNVPDDVLQLVKNTNSIVMVNFSPDFISCIPNADSSTGLPDLYPPNSTLHQVARHVIYIGSLIGYDHVGLGSDFDGIFTVPAGLEDVSKFPGLIAELLRMGVSDDDAMKIVGHNILRVWHDAEKVAQQMQADGVLPLEDDIPKVNFTSIFPHEPDI